jgi:putative acetyltransferase
MAQVVAHVRLAEFARSSDDTSLCRTLMREYATHLNASVGGEHICVDTLEAELAALPGPYAAPDGAVLLAWANDQPAGCVALKPVHFGEERMCEMKRLWVRPGHQGLGLGRLLAESVVALARERGYAAMVLDTMPRTMPAAYALYRDMGFVPVERYNDNPALRRIDAHEIAWLRKEL